MVDALNHCATARQFILYGNKETENNENVDIPSDLDLLPAPCDEIYSNDEQMNIDDYHEDDVVFSNESNLFGLNDVNEMCNESYRKYQQFVFSY